MRASGRIEGNSLGGKPGISLDTILYYYRTLSVLMAQIDRIRDDKAPYPALHRVWNGSA
jgi:hypothetical protein